MASFGSLEVPLIQNASSVGGTPRGTPRGVRARTPTADEPFMGPGTIPIRYVKFEIAGIEGVKQAVLFPDSMPIGRKVKEVLSTLKLKRPALLIEGASNASHPLGLLTKTELADPEYRTMLHLGPGESKEEDDIATCRGLAEKLESIFIALASAAQQTGSWSIGQNFGNKCFAQIMCEASKMAPKQFWVWTHHMNCDNLTETDQEINHLLFENSVPFDKANTKSSLVNVRLEGNIVEHFSMWDFGEPWKGIINKQNPLFEKRAEMKSMWCYPHADLFLLHYRATESGDFDRDYRCLDITRNLLPDRSLLGPPGLVFLGGRDLRVKKLLMNAFKHATPSILIDHTGGYTKLYSTIVDVLSKIIKGDANMTKQFLPKGEKAPKEVKKLLRAISVRQLFDYAMKKGYGDADDFSEDGSKLQLGDVRQVVDVAATWPQVLTDTIRVVDPLKMGAEEALNTLSSCFSSTYTGVQELGAANTNTDVIMEAWRMFHELHKKAKELEGTGGTHFHLHGWLVFLSVLVSVCHDKLADCREPKSDETPEPYCKLDFKLVIFFLYTMTVVLPVLSTLVGTLMSHHGHRKKWSTAKLAECQLVQHIYMFRANAGPYNTDAAAEDADDNSADDDGDEKQKPMSGAVKSRNARMMFVDNIHSIYGNIMTTALKEDFTAHNKDKLSDADLLKTLDDNVYECFKFSSERAAEDKMKVDAKDTDSKRNKKKSRADLDEEEGREGFADNSAENESHNACYVDPLTAEVYYASRLERLVKLSDHLLPILVTTHNKRQNASFVCGALASLLGATGCASWIPVVMSLGSMIQSVRTFNADDVKTMGLNHALAGLKVLKTQWHAMGNMDRRAPNFKRQLVVKTETLVLESMKTWTGGATVNTKSDTQDQGDDDKDDKGKEGKGKKR